MTTAPAVVTLYTRTGCHLCEEAARLLARFSRQYRFTVEQVDIEQDDALHRRFMFEIPVVAIGERIIAQAPIWAGSLEDALADALGE